MLKGAAVRMRINVLPMQWVALFLERPVKEGIGYEGAAGVWHIQGRSRNIDIELRIATRRNNYDIIAVQFYDYFDSHTLLRRLIERSYVVFMHCPPHQQIFSFVIRLV